MTMRPASPASLMLAVLLCACSEGPIAPVNQTGEDPEPVPITSFQYDAMGQGTFWLAVSNSGYYLVNTRTRTTTQTKVNVAYNPHMSPDGTQILSNVPVGLKWTIFTVDWGGKTRNLFATEGIFDDPSWSHDGSAIFFVLWNDGPLARTIKRVSLSDLSRTTIDPQLDQRCAWLEGKVSDAPDGTIVISSRLITNGSCGNSAIFTIKADGTGKKLILVGGDREAVRSPAWSPDGKRIAFFSVVPGTGVTSTEVKVMNADGAGMSTAATLSLSQAIRFDDDDLCWSADGSHILFTVVDVAGGHIFSVGSDGSGLTEIARGYYVSCGR